MNVGIVSREHGTHDRHELAESRGGDEILLGVRTSIPRATSGSSSWLVQARLVVAPNYRRAYVSQWIDDALA